ncbi:MAG: PAS domain S-box protein [Euryarchaeota archaeon]|nr:PAS domain S-box protein [Euryarchaeota archaeon]
MKEIFHIGKTLKLAAVRKDGTEFPVELSLSAVKIKGKWNAIGIIRDIIERKRAEDALRKSIAELERFNRLAVDRELRMVELKREVNRLCERLGEKPPYLSVMDEESTNEKITK